MKEIIALVAVACLGAVVTGCASSSKRSADEPNADAAPHHLAGTKWQLLEIQSMSDEVEVVTPDDPLLYTISFGNDDRVAFVLDCNRGTGTWTATSSSETRGSLRFGPLAVTRALCPPPSLDERIARDMDHVRSYTLQDGRLYLNLMADGGTYLWEPSP